MKSEHSNTDYAALSDSKKAALIRLSADEDPTVWNHVREEILSHGIAVKDWLEPFLLDDDPVLRRHAKEIIAHIDRQQADTEFSAFCLNHGEELDLERGAWMLARTRYPEINIQAYQAVLDDFSHDLMMKLDFGSEPEGIVAGINQHLFNTLGFHGNE